MFGIGIAKNLSREEPSVRARCGKKEGIQKRQILVPKVWWHFHAQSPAAPTSLVFAKEAAGTKTRTGRCTGRHRRAPPPSSSTTRSRSPSMAAVAGDAGNINKQARNARADWVKSPGRANWVNDVENMPTKQAAETTKSLSLSQRRPLKLFSSYPRPQWGAPTPPSSAGGPLHPSRTDHVVPTIAVVGSLVI